MALCNDKGIKTRRRYSIYACDINAPKYTKQILTDVKGEIDNNTTVVGTLMLTYNRKIIQTENQ